MLHLLFTITLDLYVCFRVIGGLLSAHLIIKDLSQPFGDMVPENYSDDLLYLSHDLASRLLEAFENTATGIPYPRVIISSYFFLHHL